MANERNRTIVVNYISHKLSKRGYEWGFGAAREENGDGGAAAAAADNGVPLAPSSTSVLRCREVVSAGPDRDCAPKRRSSGSDIHRVLREAGDELERLYQPDFTEMSRQLYLSSSMAQRRFAEVIDELFRDGVNWGRIIAFFEFGGNVCVECAAKEEMTSQVDNIAEWMTEYLNGPLGRWIQDNGGWDAFVELYGRQRDSVFNCSWPSIKTVFSLAALGAASLTIGAYLTQK
ncbi:apoptosis regulator Bcl-2 [Phyllopteryx taeniolatus]|uniref:apoptosis regulator Bcl-2 n=1 Tax=Phyllopteryx taeniolatus TaxID=161469 RepID=UPI002AD3228F|nr:apoptosis regulator Bcl-2 [Phyllopteryx taeniolatus]